MDICFTSDDGTVDGDHMMAQWSKTFIDCGEMTGKTFKVADRSAQWLRDTGFEGVSQRWFKCPVGPWPKDGKMKQVGVANVCLPLGELISRPCDCHVESHLESHQDRVNLHTAFSKV